MSIPRATVKMRLFNRSRLAASRGAAVASILLSLSAANCSSDDDPTTNSGGTSGATAGGGTSGAAAGSGSSGATAGGGTSGAAAGSGTSGAAAGSGGAMTAGGSGGGAPSQACIDFCECFETKCAGFVSVPGGVSCTTFCETFVDQKTNFECRKSMCEMSAGPETNNNDHCSHALGIGQCN
jgi:hypothetical protein